ECSVYMKRVSNSPYKIELDITDIKNVARDTKHLDPSFIKNGNDISQAFIDYAKPLVGPLPAVGRFDELSRCLISRRLAGGNRGTPSCWSPGDFRRQAGG